MLVPFDSDIVVEGKCVELGSTVDVVAASVVISSLMLAEVNCVDVSETELVICSAVVVNWPLAVDLADVTVDSVSDGVIVVSSLVTVVIYGPMETDGFVELIGVVVAVDIPCGVDTVACSVVLCVADVSDVVVNDASGEDWSVIVNSSRVVSNE